MDGGRRREVDRVEEADNGGTAPEAFQLQVEITPFLVQRYWQGCMPGTASDNGAAHARWTGLSLRMSTNPATTWVAQLSEKGALSRSTCTSDYTRPVANGFTVSRSVPADLRGWIVWVIGKAIPERLVLGNACRRVDQGMPAYQTRHR
ncbi:hypothetical protein FH972_025157 [Carpinus fangiana]|uniref:Uncharacterized protein n=1 Tax=Carpinus fangiana TaxID=176857 RepID=A0A5N6L0J1_9ROSI|nr:hypothetical protein FH972_025157 [Carpinus fangiana]